MSRRISHGFAFLATAIGLGLSLLLLWEYTSGGTGLCSAGGGCDDVRDSAFASIAGIPTPVFGVLFFAAVGALLSLGDRYRRALWVVALAGAAGGITFISIQAFSIGAYCSFCVAVDLSALAIPVSLWLGRRGDQLPGRARLVGGAFVAFAAGLIALLGASAPHNEAPPAAAVESELPEVVAAEQRDGVVTIVEFVDFECPHCRRLHHSLREALEPYADRVRVVRKHVPLPVHDNAVDAARAGCCGEQAGVGEAMADRLFEADDLTPSGCAEIAKQLGIDAAEFEACTRSPEVAARIQADVAAAQSAGVRGLPTFFVGNERFEGYRSPEQLRAAIERALRSGSSS